MEHGSLEFSRDADVLDFGGFLELLFNFHFLGSYCVLGTVVPSAEAEISVLFEENKWAHMCETNVFEHLP